MAEDEKQPEEPSEELNIIEEEKAQEKGELDYNGIFDDDYVEGKTEAREEFDENEQHRDDMLEETDGGEEIAEEPKPGKKNQDKSKKSSKKSSSEKKEAKKEEKTDPDKTKEVKEEKIAPEDPAQKPGSSKGSFAKKILIVLAILFALLLGAFGGYLYFKKTSKQLEEAKPPTTTTTPATKKTKKYVYVTASDGLNMRQNPDSSAKVLAVIPYGTKLSVIDTQNGWDKVEYNGQQGWVSADYVSETKPEDFKTYIGTGQMPDNPKFSVQYPSDWVLDGYKVSKTDNGKVYTIALGAGGHGFSEGDTSITSSQENITVNGNAGIKTTAVKDGKIVSLVTAFTKGNGYINIEFEPPAGYDQSYIDIYNKIVETFKFL